jgi:hypothetical protein
MFSKKTKLATKPFKKLLKCKFCGGYMNYLQFCDGSQPSHDPDNNYNVSGACYRDPKVRNSGCSAHIYGSNGNYKWFTHKEWEDWVNDI